ncbi:MAG: shikimate dehydrogenase [Selenomonadaceae bacterium]
MTTITGTTKNLGVIGCPIAHSLSPVIQNAAISKSGLDYVYIAMPVEKEALAEAVNGLKSLGFTGFNVTIPHKEAIIPLLDKIDESAQMIGAVNTVVNNQGVLTGYNTDVDGFVGALKDVGYEIAGKSVAVLGAGGAARAVLCGLIREGAKEISVGVRNPAKAMAVVNDFSKYFPIEVFEWHDDAFKNKTKNANLIVNTTPLGMYPNVDAMPPVDFDFVSDDAFFYDIIYTPMPTMLMKEAEKRGHRTLGGAAMLVKQGAIAFKLWTGIAPDETIMMKRLIDSLSK